MARTIKAKKQKFYVLHNLLSKFPELKGKDESVKLSNFFRAVKKSLREMLDGSAEVNRVINEKVSINQKKYAELKSKQNSLPEESVQERATLELEILQNEDDATKKVKKEKEILAEFQKKLEAEDVEVVFDNEDILFVEDVFKSHPKLFFGGKNLEGKEVLDLNTMDVIFELFESAK